MLELVRVGSVRQLAPGQEHHDPQPGHAPGDVAGQLEARCVGGVHVLEHEQYRPLTRCPRDERHDRLEQARALEVGGDDCGRSAAAGEVGGQPAREHDQILRPGAVCGRRRQRRQELADQLGPQAQGRAATEVERGGRYCLSAGRGGAGAQLDCQPRLADPGLAEHQRGRA